MQATSFTRPVDPDLTPASFAGLDVAQIAALYAGSGGGAGVDLAPLGLPWIQYVRISQLASDTWSAEIDAVSDVPEPALLELLALGAAALAFYPRRAGGKR